MAETILCYGESGTYKSSNLGEAADYIYETTGGISLLVTGDSSFTPMQQQIDRGVIIPWDLSTAKYKVSSLMRVSKGMWPVNIENGVADEGKMVPVQMCNRLNPSPEGQPAKVGAIFVEGLAAIGKMIQVYGTEEGLSMGGEKPVGEFVEQGEKFAQSSRSSYNFIQDYTRKYVFNFRALPCDRVIITSHEGKGEDEKTKRPIFGPAIVGKAGTDKVTSWFETALHFESYKVKTGTTGTDVRSKVRAHFERHQDAELATIFWPAKLSLPPGLKVDITDKYPNGYFPLEMHQCGKGCEKPCKRRREYASGLHTFLRLMDECGGAGE